MKQSSAATARERSQFGEIGEIGEKGEIGEIGGKINNGRPTPSSINAVETQIQ
jgi:hypothetical protein